MRFETQQVLSNITEQFDHRWYLPMKALIPSTIAHRLGSLKEQFKNKMETVMGECETHCYAKTQMVEICETTAILREFDDIQKYGLTMIPESLWVVAEALGLYFKDVLTMALSAIYYFS